MYTEAMPTVGEPRTVSHPHAPNFFDEPQTRAKSTGGVVSEIAYIIDTRSGGLKRNPRSI